MSVAIRIMSERMNMGGGEDRKVKCKLEDDHHHETTTKELFLSPSLYNNADMLKPLKVSPKPAVSGSEDDINKKPTEERRTKEFGFKYYMKKFKSSQALGGHQNAHRGRERVIYKMEKKLSTFGHPHFCPCSSIITNNCFPYQ